jgi:hypothetical protein
VLEGKERLDEIVAILDGPRIAALVADAVREQRWNEMADLFTNLGERNRQIVAEAVAGLPEDQRAELEREAELRGVRLSAPARS